uniref:Reverse transcriptase domain-containing protein n=1 Tax=Tanacetum cinerariifolium TaxID=118510 RepID=A0A6L2JGY5_TANCI|nr:hypothetical protein [Tanacetum cinerariifolium]
MSKVLQERGLESLPTSTEINPRDHVKSISTATADSTRIRCIISKPYAMRMKRDFVILDIPEDDDVSLILERPFMSTAYAKIDVFKRNFTLRVGEEKIVYMLKERTNLDSKTKLIGKDANKSFNPHSGDYIESNDSDMPLKSMMNQDITLSQPLMKVLLSMSLLTNDIDDHEGKKLARTLIDIPIFIRNFSIISGFTIINDIDENVTSGVVLSMSFCKKFVSCQKIMEKFAHEDKCKQIKEE